MLYDFQTHVRRWGAVLTALALCAVAAAIPATASARIIEVGEIGDEVTPSCPTLPCRAVTRTTAFQKRVDGKKNISTVPSNGRIVAWSVALAEPTSKQVEFFDDNYGGAPSAGITVFRIGKKKNRGIGRVIGESSVQGLTDYMGQSVQFSLANTLRVHKGDRVALTVPTWAPALAVNQASTTAWRTTRDKDSCDDFFKPTTVQGEGAKTAFGCGYRTERLTYSATLITQPTPNKSADDDQKTRGPTRPAPKR